jgi:hypothetical protein
MTLRLVPDQIEATFTPWYVDVYVLARLWRFLVLIEQPPQSVPFFLEHAEEFAEQYVAMLACDRPALSGKS